MGTHIVVAPNSVLRGYGRIPRKGHIEHEARKSQSELGKGIRVAWASSRQREQQMQSAHQKATSLLSTLQWLPVVLNTLNSHHGLKGPNMIWPQLIFHYSPLTSSCPLDTLASYCHKICQAHSCIQAFILAVPSIWDSLSPNILQAHFIQRSLFGDTFPAPSPI